MATHLYGLFETPEAARFVIDRIRLYVPEDKISIISRADHLPDKLKQQYETDNIVDGTLIGAALGGFLGVTATLATVFYPTAGNMLVSLGPLAGAAYGTWSGGMLGALIDLGISPLGAKELQRRIERGQLLVLAEVTPETHSAVEQLMLDYGADAIQQH